MQSPDRPRRTFLKQGAAAAFVPLIGMTMPHAPGAADPRAVVSAYLRAAQAGDVAGVLAQFAADAAYEDVTFAYRITGHEQIGAMFTAAFAALTLERRTISRWVVEDPNVVVEWQAVGIHAGPMLGVPATGRRVELRAVSLIEVRHGKIVRVTDYTDRAGLEAQLRGGGK